MHLFPAIKRVKSTEDSKKISEKASFAGPIPNEIKKLVTQTDELHGKGQDFTICEWRKEESSESLASIWESSD